MVSTAADLTQLLRAHMGTVRTDLPDEVLTTAREPLTTIDPYSQYGSGWVVRPLWEQLVSVGDPVDGADLPSCVEHLGSTYRSQSYLMACPSLGFGIAALTNTGAGIDTTRWSRFQTDLTHLALGTPSPAPGFNPVESNAPVIIPGLLLAQALSLLPLTAARSGTWRVALALGGAIVGPVLWWGYAPTRLGPRLPVASLWAQAPELGIATLVSTALALVAAALATTWAASRRHGPARRN